MPELPEVETMVRGIRPFVQGRMLTSVRRCRCSCQPISVQPPMSQVSRRTRGRTLTSVRRIAKRVVLEMDSGDAFVIEPRMTGLMLLADPPDRSHLRIEWEFAGKGEYNKLWFWDRRGLGTVRLYSSSELSQALGSERIGPDALLMTEADWRRCCARTSRPIKVALLDQKLSSGIGNLYASEILHLAGIHPEHPADRLTLRQLRRLCVSVQAVLQEAIRCEGSTLGDGTYRNALNNAGRYQHSHRVYGRADEICPTCRKTPIHRIVQAQRSTFFCPRCQK